MKPLVGAVIPHHAEREDGPMRAIESLRAQKIEWRAVVVSDVSGAGQLSGVDRTDPRVRALAACEKDWLGEACRACNTPWVLMINPNDEVAPGGLEALLGAACASVDGIVVGGFEHVSRLGRCPDVRRGAARPEDRQSVFVPPPHAVLARAHRWTGLTSDRDELAFGHPARDFAVAGRFMAMSGASPARVDDVVARMQLREPPTTTRLEAVIAAHARVCGVLLPQSPASDDWAVAHAMARLHRCVVAQVGPNPWSRLTRFPVMFAQWWARLGFFGLSPRHLLDSEGGLTRMMREVPHAAAIELLDAALEEDPRPPVLVGLGKNARVLASILHARGLPIRGCDDAFSAGPAWASADNLSVETISLESVPSGSTCIVTPWSDEAIVPRLPRSVRVLRWSDAAGIALKRSAVQLGLTRCDSLAHDTAYPNSASRAPALAECAR